MEIYVFVANVFMYVILPIAVFKLLQDFFNDLRKMWKENRKRSAECESAKRDKNKHSNYNISKKKNINNLDRWL